MPIQVDDFEMTRQIYLLICGHSSGITSITEFIFGHTCAEAKDCLQIMNEGTKKHLLPLVLYQKTNVSYTCRRFPLGVFSNNTRC